MSTCRNTLITLLFLALASPPIKAQLNDTIGLAELQRKGAAWLLSRQSEDGSWLGQTGQPAFTALACMGIYACPQYQEPAVKGQIDKALDYLVAASKPDGGIYGASGSAPDKPKARRGGSGGDNRGGSASYAVYNTSICLSALAKYNRPQDLAVCKKARAYLLDAQSTEDSQPSTGDSAGGTGYGSNRRRADLSNTAWTLEALHVTEHLDREPFNTNPAQAAKAGLAWEKALQFVSICQNLAESNQSAWVKSAPVEDRGGFIYCPEDALKADQNQQPLRSYGSMTYAGIKSLIYAKVQKEDLRMKTAFDWVKKYYTLEENPGTGPAGYYYYLHLFGKTLTLYQENTIVDAKGQTHDWKSELLNKLAETQQADGSWLNTRSGRWMESIPELSTAYCLMTLALLK
ncbi:MAG: prenyltransferase/squalene oxidase repeat-containing protein [Lentisphaeria bacterium]